MVNSGGGTGLFNHLIGLLEYRVVLGALATTLDGLVVVQAGLPSDDAELLAAAAAGTGPQARQIPAHGGIIEVRQGSEMRLIVLTETDAPASEIDRLMEVELAALEESIAA
jgi:hypothetical protein